MNLWGALLCHTVSENFWRREAICLLLHLMKTCSGSILREGTPVGVRRLLLVLLVLCSGITPGGARRTYGVLEI